MDELFNISGKHAIVTGGTNGLGYGIAEGFLERGVKVVAIGHNPKSLEREAEWKKKGYDCKVLIGDFAKRSEVDRLFNEAMVFLSNRLDIMVTSAGIQRRYRSDQFPIEEWDKVIEVNLTTTFLFCQKASQVMIPQKKGKIITIASMMTYFGGQTIPAYAASKGGVGQLTKAFSNDLSALGINVNALAPGYMDTDMNSALVNNEARRPMIDERIPMHRWGTPSDMVGPAVFLASDASNYLTGEIIPVDGGYLGK